MSKEIDTVREAMEGLLEAANHNVGGMVPGVIATWCHKALAGISAVEAEMISLKEQVERMRKYMKEDGYFDAEEICS